MFSSASLQEGQTARLVWAVRTLVLALGYSIATSLFRASTFPDMFMKS